MNEEELKTSKAYQALNQEEPLGSPPELDAAILAQAHKAVQAKPKAVGSRSRLTLRWGAPIASAALVVLSVTVFIVMPELEQQQAVPTYAENMATDAHREAVQQLMQAKERSEKQESKVSQRMEPKAMQKRVTEVQRLDASPAPMSPMASGMSAQYFSEADSLAMDSLEEELLSDITVLKADKWVEKIQQLIVQEDWLAADEQFKAFAKHYPEHEFNKEYAKLKQE